MKTDRKYFFEEIVTLPGHPGWLVEKARVLDIQKDGVRVQVYYSGGSGPQPTLTAQPEPYTLALVPGWDPLGAFFTYLWDWGKLDPTVIMLSAGMLSILAGLCPALQWDGNISNVEGKNSTSKVCMYVNTATGTQVQLVPVVHLVLPSGVAVCPPPEWAPKNTLPIYATIGFKL